MSKVWVIDTEVSNTTFKPEPNGHIVEFGAVQVDLETRTIGNSYSAVVKDPFADESAWVFQNTTLSYGDMLVKGVTPSSLDRFMSHVIKDEVTSYNIAFDRLLIRRDMPILSGKLRWGEDIMLAASKVAAIPRRHAGERHYPTALASYNYLCPDDPCFLFGEEEHRALADAQMEAHILLRLYDLGLWRPMEAVS